MSHTVNPLTSLQDHTSPTGSLVATLSFDKGHCASWPGQLQSYLQMPEGLSGVTARPVLSSQDYPGDESSSSDDEGKLIIEL